MARRKPRSKVEFLELEQQVWEEMNDLVAGLPAEKLKEPGAAGDWSVKDVWAHIADWMVRARQEVPLVMKGEKVKVGIQSFNVEHYEMNRRVTLTQARRRLERERKQFLSFVKRLPEKELLGNSRVYSWVSYSCFNHYAEHIPGFRQLREKDH